MKNHRLKKLIILLALPFTGCVSVNIPTSSGKPAENVVFTAPPKPFKEIKSGGDRAWMSSASGNTISYLSECNSSVDPSLQQLESETLNALEKLKVLVTDKKEYNGREALSTLAQGEVDGVPVKTQVLIFKKNNCNYTLGYSGVAKQFDSEKKYFDMFVESFRAP